MRRIVLSGSMYFREEIQEYQKQLKELGYDVIIPRECKEIHLEKATASRIHFSEIIQEKTDSLLVINLNKREQENYIGPNTFAEIAFAFYFHKNIYVLQDYYLPYEEELKAWGVISLKGEIEKLEKGEKDAEGLSIS